MFWFGICLWARSMALKHYFINIIFMFQSHQIINYIYMYFNLGLEMLQWLSKHDSTDTVCVRSDLYVTVLSFHQLEYERWIFIGFFYVEFYVTLIMRLWSLPLGLEVLWWHKLDWINAYSADARRRHRKIDKTLLWHVANKNDKTFYRAFYRICFV